MNKQEFKVKLEDLLGEMQDMTQSEQKDALSKIGDWVSELPDSRDVGTLESKIEEFMGAYYFSDPKEVVSETITFLQYVNF